MDGKLLQVLPGIIRRVDGELEMDVDFCESLRLYLDNFQQVVIACPIKEGTGDSSLRRCRPIEDLPERSRLRVIPLPNAYHWREFVRHYYVVSKILRTEIEQADYLLFSPHTLIGDWPTVAVHQAVKLRRRYALDADVVYDKFLELAWSRKGACKRFIGLYLLLPAFRRLYRFCLEHSSLALLQGQDVYEAFAQFCNNPHKVYHMPVSMEDYIIGPQLQKKLESLSEARPLSLCYVGRCIEMKGPLDWLKVLHEVIKSGIDLRAIWLGDGSLLPQMRAMTQRLGIADYVEFPGYVSSRSEILELLRRVDLFLFCHKTPESPRCLVEALVSACPLVGYGSAYPKDLIAQNGGGEFVAVGDWQGLADKVKRLGRDRRSIRALIQAAGASGRLYDRDATMQTRIDLIRKYLLPGAA